MHYDGFMTETTAPNHCDDHYFVPAEIDEISGEEDAYGRNYIAVRWYCPVKGCGATFHDTEALLELLD